MRDSPFLNMSWRVPRDMEEEMDDFFDEHERFMRRTHTMLTPRLEGAVSLADDAMGPRLSEFYVSKGPELTTPLDLATSADTGNLLYNRADTFAGPEAVNRHLEIIKDMWPEGWGKMQRYNRDFGVFSDFGNMKLIRSLEDRVGAVKTEKGNSTVSMTWRVPKEKEAELDEFFANHEKWMRSSHASGGLDAPKDDKVPRITSYNVAKGPELNDPMDKSKGETGNLIYTLSETYPDADGVDKHVALAKESWKDGWEQLKKYNTDYSISTTCGSSKVITSRF